MLYVKCFMLYVKCFMLYVKCFMLYVKCFMLFIFNIDYYCKLTLFEDILCVELKSIDGLLPIHDAILLTYMKMLKKPKGVLINFNCVNIFKEGQKTLVNELFALLPNE